MLEQFLQAVGNASGEGLATLLADEVTFWDDSVGQERDAAQEPVHGHLAVASMAACYPVAVVNSRPTLLIGSADDTPVIVVSVEVGEGRIQTIWAIAQFSLVPCLECSPVIVDSLNGFDDGPCLNLSAEASSTSGQNVDGGAGHDDDGDQ